jgi:tRNA 2-selenouridine synthase
MARLAEFDAVIDARSEANTPRTTCPRRSTGLRWTTRSATKVGTMYKQVSPFEARKRGAAWCGNIARHIERE